jgi:hypothetical protein
MPINIWSQLTNLVDVGDIQQEMGKKYRNTILKIVDGKTTTYGKFTCFSKSGYYMFQDLHGNSIQLAQNTDVDVRIWYPKRGLYNVETPAYTGFIYYARTANRQYRRGINEENTHISNPAIRLFGDEFTGAFEISTLAQIATNSRRFRHLDEVTMNLDDPNSKLLSYAVNDRWGISLPIETNEPGVYDLWMYRSKVGQIKNNSIYLHETTFVQELLDEHNKDWYAGYVLR